MSGLDFNMDQNTQLYNVEDYSENGQVKCLPSGMPAIIKYLDLQSIPDNSHEIPDLAPGQLQPLEDNQSVDELFKDVNFELLSQMVMDPPVCVDQKPTLHDPDPNRFHRPVTDDHVQMNSYKRYAFIRVQG